MPKVLIEQRYPSKVLYENTDPTLPVCEIAHMTVSPSLYVSVSS